MKKNNKGFTLVEIIVVLVILAILAAIAIPTVLGYVDDAKEARELAKLRESLIAAQVTFVKSAASGESGQSESNDSNDSNEHPVNRFLTDNQAKDLVKGLETEPYILMYGTGDPDVYGATSSEASKVYCIVYQKDRKSKPWFYDGKKWSHRYLWKTKGNGYDPSRAMYVKTNDNKNYHNYMRDVKDNRGNEDTAVSIYYAYVKGKRVYTTKPDVDFWDSLKKVSE